MRTRLIPLAILAIAPSLAASPTTPSAVDDPPPPLPPPPTTAPAGPVTFHSAAYGFTLTGPPGWLQIPREAFGRQASHVISAELSGKVVLEAGFQPAFLRTWFASPQIVVTVTPYASIGQAAPMSDAELKQLADTFNDPERKKTIGRGETAWVQERLKSPGSVRAELDLRHSLINVYRSATTVRFGPVRSKVVMHCGRDAIVQVGYQAYEDQWQRFDPVVEVALDSFRFDPDRERPAGPAAPATPRPAGPTDDGGDDPLVTIATAVAGAGVLGVAIVLAAVLWWRRRTARPREW